MKYADYELDDLLSSVNCKEDLLALETFLWEFPEFFNAVNRKELEDWIEIAKPLFYKSASPLTKH